MKSAEGLYASISPGPRHSCLEALSDIAGRSHQHARAVSLGKMGARKISKQDPAPEPGVLVPFWTLRLARGRSYSNPRAYSPLFHLRLWNGWIRRENP